MRVCIVPEYPLSLMTGGLQVQALRTFDALSALGGDVDPELFDWSKTASASDLYHFIGFPPYLVRIAELVRQMGRPYVLTLLFGSNRDPISLWAAAGRRFFASEILRKRGRSDAIRRAARVITITDSDAEAAHVIYGLQQNQIEVVPNGVATEFFEGNPQAWHLKFGEQPFVLCVGAIQTRKGQLLLAQACNCLQLPLVLLGPVLPGERAYGQRVEQEMRENQRFGGQWLRTLTNNDPLLHSAYAACRIFALLSSDETQPLSVMEAMASHKPVLLLRAPYTKERLFKNLTMITSATLTSAIHGLKEIWDHPQFTDLPKCYTWPSVANQLKTIYRRAATNS